MPMKADRRGFLFALVAAPLLARLISKPKPKMWRVSWKDGRDTFSATSPSLLWAHEMAEQARYGRPKRFGNPAYRRISRARDRAVWDIREVQA